MSRFMKCFKHIEAGVRHTEAWKFFAPFSSRSRFGCCSKTSQLGLEMILSPTSGEDQSVLSRVDLLRWPHRWCSLGPHPVGPRIPGWTRLDPPKQQDDFSDDMGYINTVTTFLNTSFSQFSIEFRCRGTEKRTLRIVSFFVGSIAGTSCHQI